MVAAGVTGRLPTDPNKRFTNTVSRGVLGIVWLLPNQEPGSTPLALGPSFPDPFPQPGINQPRKWYRVSLRVAPDQPPQGTCEGGVIGAKNPRIWDQVLTTKLGPADPPVGDPPLLGNGVGVFVLNGAARFRNVELKPY